MNRAELLVDGHAIVPALLRDLQEACRTIHVSIFLLFRDPIGEEIARLLARKASEGVAVRVILNVAKTDMGDPFSTGERQMMRHDPTWPHNPTKVEPLCKWMRDQGIQVIDSNIDYEKIPEVSPRLRSIASQIKETISLSELHVDHRKLITIDGCIGYCGGANLGAQYLYHVPFDPSCDAREEAKRRLKSKQPEPWWKWHDSLTRFEGPIVMELEKHFRDRWRLDGGERYEPIEALTPPGRGEPIHSAELLCNEPNDKPNQVREKYLELIAGARESIFIENPYLYHQGIVDALIAAKRRTPKLQVDLVLPDYRHNDNRFGQDAQQHAYQSYLEAGINVYEYLNHFNHLKLAVFDSRWSIHGSTNLNYRSLENDKDFELVVLVDDEPLARKALKEVRDRDIAHSRRYTRRDLRSWRGRLRLNLRDPRTLLLLSRKVL
jgi:cardiolipin synthase